jgi:hypothetical protein
MTAEALVAVLEQTGVILRVEGGMLKLQAPVDRVPGADTIAELRENKTAVLEYLRGREQPQEIQFPSFPTPIVRETEKLKSPQSSKTPCGSPHCAGCYEVAPGIRIHPPKCGADYRVCLERWEAKGRVQ